jgi:hypothetical protein
MTRMTHMTRWLFVVLVAFVLLLTGCMHALVGAPEERRVSVGNNLVQDASAITSSPYVGHDWFYRDGWSVRVEFAPVGWVYASYRLEKLVWGTRR